MRRPRLVEADDTLTDGRWVGGLIKRWVPTPPPPPISELIACPCGATIATPCAHRTRLISRRCPCGNRPPEGRDYCTTECRDDAESEVAA